MDGAKTWDAFKTPVHFDSAVPHPTDARTFIATHSNGKDGTSAVYVCTYGKDAASRKCVTSSSPWASKVLEAEWTSYDAANKEGKPWSLVFTAASAAKNGVPPKAGTFDVVKAEGSMDKVALLKAGVTSFLQMDEYACVTMGVADDEFDAQELCVFCSQQHIQHAYSAPARARLL